MSTVVTVVAGGVVGAHGLGHVLGWMPAWGIAKFEGVSSESWLLGSVVGEVGERFAAGALYLVPMIGFGIAAVGLLSGQAWWRPLAAASACVSLAATALFPHAFPLGSTIGSVAVNAAVIAWVVSGWGVADAAA
jgi:hypothetical protein